MAMNAMVLNHITDIQSKYHPLRKVQLPDPVPGERDILIRVTVCGVCHTELDEIEGRTPPSHFPMVLGHEVVGRVQEIGKKAKRFKTGDRVGVGWFYSSCGKCSFCASGNENLCKDFKATGRDAFGGYAEYMVVPEDSAFAIPDIFTDAEAAPLLCAGAVGYRSFRLANLKKDQNLGLTGFGASAHLVLQMAKHLYPTSRIFVFARSEKERRFAKELGAVWAGGTEETSPEKLHAMIDTTPVWKPIVEALRNLEAGGRLVINAIRKEDSDKECLLKLSYPTHLWLEKEIKSVANVTRMDIREFMEIAAEIPVKPEVQEYPLEEANKALGEMKEGRIRGAKVLRVH